MDENNRIVCPHCGFDYLSTKHAFCPNCNAGKEKKNKLIVLSEWAFDLPVGIQIAILLTSTYAVYAVSDALVHLLWVNLGVVILYDAFVYFWFSRLDDVERPVWFLTIILVMYLPVLTLIMIFILA